MSPKDALRLSIGMSDYIVDAYIKDLDDADLLIRPVPGMNHIAWQLGHLISAERSFVEKIKPGSSPPLPAGFDEAHSKETTTLDDPKKFLSRAEYQDLWKKQRAATLAYSTRFPNPSSTRPTPRNTPNGPRPSPRSWP